MGMTVTNLNTLSLLHMLNRTTGAQADVMAKMATGSRINRGADDPSGLLALSSLDAELTSVTAGISNNQRTDAILTVADNALSEISSLVAEVQRLADETSNDAGLSGDEVAANQAQIDDALASIDRIVANTQFNGKKLLDGSMGIYATPSTATALTDIKVFSKKTETTDATVTVTLNTAASAAAVSGIINATTTAPLTFSVQGSLGTAVIQATTGMTVASMAGQVNAAAAQTGVSASVNGTGLVLYSKSKGADEFVRVRKIDGTDNLVGGEDTGVDARVSVNGQQTAVDGNHVNYNGNGISMAFDIGVLAEGASATITVSGNSGATFQLGSTDQTRATIGITGLYTSMLGNATDGYLSELGSGGAYALDSDPGQAAVIARKAAAQIATQRGRIGGFQRFQVQTSMRSLESVQEGLQSARSVIADVDYAVASSELNRQNILVQSTMSLLGLANQQSAQVLSLLR